MQGNTEKKGSRRLVGAISSLAEWANWEVRSLICSAAPVASSINSLLCVRVCGVFAPKRFVFLLQLPLSIIINQALALAAKRAASDR